MTNENKNEIMKIILPACIHKKENTTPYEVMWFANAIISGLEDGGYFQNNMISLNPEVFESYTDQL